MKTTKQLANEMADRVFQIRDAYTEKKKSKHRRIMYFVKYAAPAAACFGLAITFGISYWAKYEKMSDVEVQPSTAYITTAAADGNKTSITTVVTDNTVSVTTAKTKKTVSGKVSTEENTRHDAVTEETAVSEESLSAVTDTPITAETKTTALTEQPAETLPQTTETEERKAVKGAFKVRSLLDSEDPITVFDRINVGGKDYEGRKYITANDLDGFLIAWIEEMTLTKDDTVLNERVVEPVTVYGIMENDRNEIIVNFTAGGSDIYGYYWAVEETEN